MAILDELTEQEVSKNKEKKSDKDGSTRILCEHGSKLPKRTLVLCESDNKTASWC